MTTYASIVGIVWARARGVLVPTAAIALGVQFIANAGAAEKATSVALLLGSVLAASALLAWAARGRAPALRILGGLALAGGAALFLQAHGTLPAGGRLVASLDAVLLTAPFAYCLLCAAVDGLWSAPSGA